MMSKQVFWLGAVFGVCANGFVAAAESLPVPDAVLSAQEVCARIAKRLASVYESDCVASRPQASGGVSVKGTPILVKEYPPLADKEPQARILLVAGVHPDELATVSIVFKWMNTLNKHHSGLFHWRLVPVLNPDGLFLKKATRTNASGVDLNRNFPTLNWDTESRDYWVRRTGKNPRRYPGPRPLSEPESLWLAKEVAAFKPHAIVSLHAPYSRVDYDGPRAGPSKLGRLRLNLMGTYPGSLGNYAGVLRDIPVVTIELPYAGIMLKPHEISALWVDLVKWLRTNIPRTPLPLTWTAAELQ
ncbi:MAG: murein peptide amidase A [Gammaproteobacteria bacterium]|nr:MAG: murein peptide amidase A [Gammaproteobacteria bacterium]